MLLKLSQSNRQFTETDFLWFCQSLDQQLQQGLLVQESMDYIASISSRKTKKVIQQMSHAINQGQSWLDTLFAYAPQTIPYQLTGTDIEDPQILLQWLIQYYKNKQKKRQALMTALRYPLVLILLMGMMGVMLLTVVLPQQRQLMMQMGADEPVVSYTIFLIIFALVIGAIVYSYDHIFRKCDRPVIGQLCCQLGGLLTIGLSWKSALLAIKPSQSLQNQWQSFQQDFFTNPQFADQFAFHFKVTAMTRTRLFYIQNIVDVGSRLAVLGNEIEQRRHEAWLHCIRLIHPLLLIGIGVIILWVASVLLNPMMMMLNQLKI